MNINNKPCPCHSDLKYKKCCRPYHKGIAQAPSPEALLRSRYAAYAIGEAPYIIATTHKDHPEAQKTIVEWTRELGLFARHTTFDSLVILDQSMSEDLQEGWITFEAGLIQNGQNASFKERSHFVKQEGRWLYESAEELEDA